MENKYPKYTVYEEIYKRYFKRSPQELIDKSNLKPGEVVLDICGGNGRLSLLAKKLGADVSYLDQEEKMIPFKKLEDENITPFIIPIQNFVEYKQNKLFDIAFCQQAVTYWIKNINIKKFANLFKENGRFIFNTFNKKPTEKPMIKEYNIEGINYMEISYLVGDKVYHVQIREGYEPHTTVFNWVSEQEFKNILSPYFDIEIFNDGNTSIYKCIKK